MFSGQSVFQERGDLKTQTKPDSKHECIGAGSFS